MIACGIDIIEIQRLKDINPAIRERFLKRVYTANELKQARDSFETLSGLFAVKEAVSKVLGTGIGYVAWQDIEIIHQPSGEPRLQLHGNAKLVADQKGLRQWSVSISHDRDKAVGMAVATGDG